MKNENRYRRPQDDANRYYDDAKRYNRYDDRYNDYDDFRGYYDNYSPSNYRGRNDNNFYDNNRNWERRSDNYDPYYTNPYRDERDEYQGNYYRSQNSRYESPMTRNWRNDYYNNRDDRNWWDKTKDEVSSWFGDEDADRRRRMDEMRDINHRGKGPKNYKKSPEKIKEDVNDRLSDNWMIDASDIEVEVNGSEVTLNGTVDSKSSKRRAEDIAESVAGVTHVQNNLRVNMNSENRFSDTSSTNTSKLSNSAYSNGARRKESMSHN